MENFHLILDQPNTEECMMVVAEDDEGNFKGVIAGVVVRIPYSSEVIANEMIFWTDGSPKAFQKLHEMYLGWAATIGCDKMFISAPPTKPEGKWRKFYENLGYSPCEYRYVRKVT